MQICMIDLVILASKLAQQREEGATLRQAGDKLRKRGGKPARVQWLYKEANQVDQDVVKLQRDFDDTRARLEIEARAKQTQASPRR